ncbi:DUF1329 domain-containing protein [Marinobacterium aestuariivivens]|uniref:DUF1329 domain-containing protein n=1 Tax=Marinobacterium aestuariivivens TaxID=1698799 RepID=A0ABW2A3P4_9GAMM
MKATMKPLAAATLLLALGAPLALAKVSPEEAARLGGPELTPMGAERAGNADGTIPEWTGSMVGAPDGVKYDTGTVHPNPYAGEKPLFVITAQNMGQYADKLTDGQKALFGNYPDTFKMPVYPSHRDGGLAPRIYENIKKNALSAELESDGNGVLNAYGAAPFPIPKSGIEVLWNHNLHYSAFREYAFYTGAAVYPNGQIAYDKVEYDIASFYNDPQLGRTNFDGLQASFMVNQLAPARQKGEILLGHTFINPKQEPSQIWQYIPGTRRVRRAPNVAYDTPQGAGGLRGVDEDRLFNGSPDRFDWKLLGKKEIYIPYNAYALDDPSLKYEDLLTVGHINSDHTRYELHRVWVIEGTLREGARHIYNKRRLYIDEDSWAAVLADNYDARGELWRTAMQHFIYAYDLEGFHARVAVYHDLISGMYSAQRLINEEEQMPIVNTGRREDNFYTAANLRKMGNR